MGLKKSAKRCRDCSYAHTCDHKELEHHGCLLPAAGVSLADTLAPVIVPHEYRDIKIGEHTTITIDLVDIRKQIERDHYEQLYQWGC